MAAKQEYWNSGIMEWWNIARNAKSNPHHENTLRLRSRQAKFGKHESSAQTGMTPVKHNPHSISPYETRNTISFHWAGEKGQGDLISFLGKSKRSRRTRYVQIAPLPFPETPIRFEYKRVSQQAPAEK